MRITLDVSPEAEANLALRASLIGVPLDRFLENVIEQAGWTPVIKEHSLTGPEKAEALRRWAMSFPANLPVLNLEGITREKMYEQD